MKFDYMPSKNWLAIWDMAKFKSYVSRVMRGDSGAVKIFYAKLCFLSDDEKSIWSEIYSEISASDIPQKGIFEDMARDSGCFWTSGDMYENSDDFWGLRLI